VPQTLWEKRTKDAIKAPETVIGKPIKNPFSSIGTITLYRASLYPPDAIYIIGRIQPNRSKISGLIW
jgi:hypothetical protein